jgi:hypothetical protein
VACRIGGIGHLSPERREHREALSPLAQPRLRDDVGHGCSVHAIAGEAGQRGAGAGTPGSRPQEQRWRRLTVYLG